MCAHRVICVCSQGARHDFFHCTRLTVLRQGDRLVASPPAYTADLSALPAALDGAKRLTEVLQVRWRDIHIIVLLSVFLLCRPPVRYASESGLCFGLSQWQEKAGDDDLDTFV